METKAAKPTKTDSVRRVVIVGGGFAGLYAAKALGRSRGVSILMIDRRNHHLFQPLLYQVATAELNPSDIGVPIRYILAGQKNTAVQMDEIISVDLSTQTVHTLNATHPFDYLVLACGASHSYFGHDDWEESAPGLKTIEQALEIRRRLLTAFEKAEKLDDSAARKRALTFVIIGGGPTGVEMAGAVAELAASIVTREFRNIQPNETRIVLVQSQDRVLPAFAPSLSAKARQALQAKGVEILLGKRAEEISARGVRLDNGWIESETVIWAAGVKPSPLNTSLGVPLDKEGRVVVNPDLSVPGHANFFVLGDQARFDTPQGPLPGLAPVAMQQGKTAARNILRDLAGKPRKRFQYVDKGSMAVIGRAYAVIQWPFLRLSGFLAWLLWIFVHIMYLAGHRNRIIVLLDWAWNYATFKRGVRIITHRYWKEHGAGEE